MQGAHRGVLPAYPLMFTLSQSDWNNPAFFATPLPHRVLYDDQ